MAILRIILTSATDAYTFTIVATVAAVCFVSLNFWVLQRKKPALKRNKWDKHITEVHSSGRLPHEPVTTSLIDDKSTIINPISVNFHFTRKCNKECGFCFHTEKSSHVASDEEMMEGLALLKDAGMRKINFAGGEPFLYPRKLAMLCRYCKDTLRLESVSIITNGTKVTEAWLEKNGQYIDILGVSCDSFNEATNMKIGRGTGNNVTQLFRIRDWCRNLGIKFKLNTVVCTLNWEEDMSSTVAELNPFRWKCFQVLLVESENDASSSSTRLDKRKRNARTLLITDLQYKAFCDRHNHLECFVPESNELMASSYLILDEYLRFLDKGSGKEKQSSSILTVGVTKALKQVTWDQDAFIRRGGLYEWSRQSGEGGLCNSELPEALQF